MDLKEHKARGVMPGGRFVTTYAQDYKAFSERQRKPKTEAAPVSLPKMYGESGPGFRQCFYKTTNSIYASSGCSQPPSLPLHDTTALLILTEVRAAEVGAARYGEEEKGPKGVVVLSSHIGWVCCEDFPRSVCREAGLQHLLHLPVNSSPDIAVRDAESWNNSAYLRPATAVKSDTFLQTPPSCAAVRPHGLYSKRRASDHSQLTVHRTEPRGRSGLTEYQANFSAAWAQPKIQKSDIPHDRLL